MYEYEDYNPGGAMSKEPAPVAKTNIDKSAIRNSSDIGPAVQQQENEERYDSNSDFMDRVGDLWDKIVSLTPDRAKTLEQKINAITTAESMVAIEGGFLSDTELSKLRERLETARKDRVNSSLSTSGPTPEGALEVNTRVYEREVADLKSKSKKIIDDILSLDLIEIGPNYVDTMDKFRPRGEAIERDRKDIEKITKEARDYLDS